MLQPRQMRRRQIPFVRLWGRELTTHVFELQYKHTMSIYCHKAKKTASGKLYIVLGIKIPRLPVAERGMQLSRLL